MQKSSKTQHHVPVSKTLLRNIAFFSLLSSAVIFYFYNLFRIDFVLDDFFFLKISQVHSLSDFVGFFSPIKSYFFRPLTTEVFYFLIRILHYNLFLSHTIILITYGIGLYFLYACVKKLTNNLFFAYLLTSMYALHLVHVFQLYLFNTFQEVALFTFLVISFYYFLQKRYMISIIFFCFSLLSKESAIFYPLALGIYALYQSRLQDKKQRIFLIIFALLSFFFFIIYRIGASHVTEIDIYTVHLNPRLIINNIQWYFLWSLGLPNFLPNFTKSIFSNPSPDFWNLFHYQEYKHYFYSLGIYYLVFFITMFIYYIKHKNTLRRDSKIGIVLFILFLIFIAPTLPIIHRWMVRLTVSLVFILFAQSYLLVQFYKSGKIFRFLAFFLIGTYFFMHYWGARVHESSSLIFLESEIVQNTRTYFSKHPEVADKQTIYFQDTPNSPLGGSKKLKHTFGNQFFLDYFFPGKDMKAVYAFETPNAPHDAAIILSDDLIFKK